MKRSDYITTRPMHFRFIAIPTGTPLDSPLFRDPSRQWIESAIENGAVSPIESDPPPGDGDTSPPSPRPSGSRTTSRKS